MKSYGSITYNSKKKRWLIECQPHVAIRLKRIFGKIDKGEHGVITLSATEENAKDLRWFLLRYPMEVDDLDRLTKQSDRFEERATLVDRLLTGVEPAKSFNLKLPARNYQEFAANMWLATHGLLLADDIGTGKTLSSLCGLMSPGMTPTLVVTLTHLTHQWEEQVHKFTDLTTHILRKGTPYDITKFCKGKQPDIIISNYHKLSGWAEVFGSGVIHSVIFDEAHELRHSTSLKYKAAKHIGESVDFRMGLTASPTVNYGGEIFNVINVLCPDKLGSQAEFEREWCTYIYGGKTTITDPKAFGLYARESGLMLRRTRQDVKRELPEVISIVQEVESDPKVLDKLKGQAIELAKLILKQGEDFKGQKMQASGEFDLRMRQATGIAKAKYVADFVRFLIEESDEPVVLFGWHRSVYDIWLELLKDFNPVMYTGSESPHAKEEARKKFISGKSKVMVISLRSGLGLDGLQNVSHIAVFGELDWANIHSQCIGRVYRDGQTESVLAYYLVANQGSDPIMRDVLGIKGQQLEGINNPTADTVLEGSNQQGEYIKKLAADFLAKQGVTVEEITDESAEKVVS